jgi:hypothetical protein
MVEESMSSAPFGAFGRDEVLDQTASTCLPAGSMVMTTSAPAIAAAAFAAMTNAVLLAASSQASATGRSRCTDGRP